MTLREKPARRVNNQSTAIDPDATVNKVRARAHTHAGQTYYFALNALSVFERSGCLLNKPAIAP
jgi:hypothetical protein